MAFEEHAAGLVQEVDVNGEKYRVSVAPTERPPEATADQTAAQFKSQVLGRDLPVWEDG